jgi:hypothetical protein
VINQHPLSIRAVSVPEHWLLFPIVRSFLLLFNQI